MSIKYDIYEGMLISTKDYIHTSVIIKEQLLDELKRQAKANGWSDDEIENANFIDNDGVKEIQNDMKELK